MRVREPATGNWNRRSMEELFPLCFLVVALLVVLAVWVATPFGYRCYGPLPPWSESARVASLDGAVRLAMNHRGYVVLNGEYVETEQLRNRLGEAIRESREKFVSIDADRQLPFYKVRELAQLAATQGAESIFFATMGDVFRTVMATGWRSADV